MCCSVLQCVAVCCKRPGSLGSLRITAIQYMYKRFDWYLFVWWLKETTYRDCNTLQRTATHCHTLHDTSTQCNMQQCGSALQHSTAHCIQVASQCNALQHTATHCNTLQRNTTHCNALQHTATHCNTLQHNATQIKLKCSNGTDDAAPHIWYEHTHTHTHTHARTHTHTNSHTHSHKYTLTHLYTNAHTHTHTHTHTHAHTRTHTHIWCGCITCLQSQSSKICLAYHQDPQTEKIGLKIITTAKFSNMFSRESPYISKTFSRESPKFQAAFYASKRSPRHSQECPGKQDKSGDPNILRLASSVSGCVCICICVCACVCVA